MKTLFLRSTVSLTALSLVIAIGQANSQTLPKKELPPKPVPPAAKHVPAATPNAGAAMAARKPIAPAAKQPTAPAAKKPTTPEPKKAETPVKAKAGQSDIGVLDQAYELLAHADHDYNGHRANALGGSVSGGGKGGENQADLDSQVRNAQALLRQAVGSLTGAARGDISSAISQLSIALSVK
jgi:hypothetical protein